MTAKERLSRLSPEARRAVDHALREGDDETAIELIFEQFPQATRDEVVDVVNLFDATTKDQS